MICLYNQDQNKKTPCICISFLIVNLQREKHYKGKHKVLCFHVFLELNNKNLTHWSLRSFCPWTPGSYHFQGFWSPNKLSGLLKYCIKLPDWQNVAWFLFIFRTSKLSYVFFLLIFLKQRVSHVLLLDVTCLLIELAFFSFKRAYNT